MLFRSVYLALNLFGKRQTYTHYPSELQRDIKAFFGGNPQAQQAAKASSAAIGTDDDTPDLNTAA